MRLLRSSPARSVAASTRGVAWLIPRMTAASTSAGLWAPRASMAPSWKRMPPPPSALWGTMVPLVEGTKSRGPSRRRRRPCRPARCRRVRSGHRRSEDLRDRAEEAAQGFLPPEAESAVMPSAIPGTGAAPGLGGLTCRRSIPCRRRCSRSADWLSSRPPCQTTFPAPRSPPC